MQGAAASHKLFLSESGKVQARYAGILKKSKLRQKKKGAAARATEALMSKIDRGNGYFCCRQPGGNPDCGRSFHTAVLLQRHIAKGKCTKGFTMREGKRAATCDLVGMRDRMKRLAGENTVGVRDYSVRETFEVRTQNNYTLISGQVVSLEPSPCGFANKPSRAGRRKYSKAQIGFLKWCFAQGVKEKAKKLTAEAATALMPLHGTNLGQARYPSDGYWKATPTETPTFPLRELLDHWTIKPWFSQQKTAFETAARKAEENSVASIEVTTVDETGFIDEEV